MRATRKTILLTDWNEIFGRFGRSWAWSLCCLFLRFLELPTASYSQHEPVAMNETREILLLIDCNEIWKIKNVSGFVVPQFPTASCKFLAAATKLSQCNATREMPLGKLTAHNYK
jgi:hypothetical protein